MNYAYYSSLALVSSVVIYAAAMLAHAAEWAAARNVPVGAEVREPAMVGAADGGASGGPESVAARPAATDDDAAVRVDMFGRIGVLLTVVGFVLSVSGVVLRGMAAGRAPWGNMF